MNKKNEKDIELEKLKQFINENAIEVENDISIYDDPGEPDFETKVEV